MNRQWRISMECMARIASVLLVALAGGLLLREVARTLLDILYRSTNSSVLLVVFRALADMSILIIGALCMGSLALAFNWIMAPVYNSIPPLLDRYIDIDGSGWPLDELPRHMEGLQASLLDINRKLQLWQYATRQAEQRKDELVVYLAHDIRTPLTSVLGYLELLDENPQLPDGAREKYTGIALSKARRMEALVEELFDVTRFNIGNMEVERRDVDAEVLLNQLVEELLPELAGRNIDISVKNEGVTRMFIDPEKMARALDNVLHNAVYYTPEGGSIEVKAYMQGERSCIEISNTGMDIPQDKLNRYFEKFYRGDEARQSATGGSGLGLAIARNIIEAHGGNITASNANKVTSFKIVI